MSKLIKADFNHSLITFNDDGWINATEVANYYGKRIDHWLSNQETKEYIEKLNTRNYGDLIMTRKGKNGGTWLHPKLAIPFARWLSIDFSIWCDEQIDSIIHGNQSAIDWNMLRHASKSTNKVANEILQMVRMEQGKETQSHHYANEAKLVNWALTGEFKSVNRDALSIAELNLLASLENRNSVLLGRGVDRETRKEMLSSMAEQQKIKRLAA
jgi:hypothetical protein